jgi:putative flippase GtrA
MRRDSHPFLQFVKYGFCGVAAFATHQIIWAILSTRFFPSFDSSIAQEVRATNSIISNCIAFLFSTTVAYITNILWVFTPGRHSRTAEIFYFFAISCISLIGGLLAGPWMIRVYGIHTLLAQLSMAVASVLINYVCRKFLIFKH